MSKAQRATRPTRRRRNLLALTALAAAGAAAWSLRELPAALGGRPDPLHPRIRNSPQFRDGVFHNAPSELVREASGVPDLATIRRALFERDGRVPTLPVPTVRDAAAGDPAAAGVEIVWYGHASTLVEIEGNRVLLDPVWSDRCSPAPQVGPRRLHRPPVELDELPQVDAVLISHDHYDHLDMPTVRRLVAGQSAPFLVPLGIGSHLRRWGVPEHRIIELDWDETCTLGDLTLTLTAAHHFSGRFTTRNTTLWGSWVIAGPQRKVFYTGDSGYFEGYARIGEQHGPFDVALVQTGAYDVAWPDIHMTPEEAVQTHLDLRAGLLVPVHWCTFNLAPHPWAEPIERLLVEAKAQDVPVSVPRPGQRLDVDNPPELDGWWETIA